MSYVSILKPEDAKRRTFKGACTANKVAVETAGQTDEHRRCDGHRAARKRAVEADDQADERRKLNRHCAARERAVETADKADERRELNRPPERELKKLLTRLMSVKS